MWKYLTAAYFLRLPANGPAKALVQPLVTLALGILGFFNPWFWLGLGLQAGVVMALASNANFRRLADAQRILANAPSDEEKREALRRSMGYKSRQRLRAFEKRCRRALELERKSPGDLGMLRGTEDALRRLQWTYLKLLLAQDLLASPHVQGDEEKLQAQLADLEAALARPGATEAANESREATRLILRKRLQTLEHREQTLDEIEADLARVEAQVELALETSTLQDEPPILSVNVDLAADLLDTSVYGDHAATIRDVDRAFGEAEATDESAPRVAEG